METIFRFNRVADINKQFFSILKKLFKDEEVEISVRTYSDETEFLLKDDLNKDFLSKSILDLNENENLISFTGSEYETLINDLIKK